MRQHQLASLGDDGCAEIVQRTFFERRLEGSEGRLCTLGFRGGRRQTAKRRNPDKLIGQGILAGILMSLVQFELVLYIIA